MTPAAYDEAKLLPLTTNALIERRVAELLGRAIQRQLWVLFLDENDVQLPLLVPLDELPQFPPDPHDLALQSILRQLTQATGAHAVIFVLERYADAALCPADIAWSRALHRACDEAKLPLRGILVSHKRGVRWVAQDDYRFGGGGGASSGVGEEDAGRVGGADGAGVGE